MRRRQQWVLKSWRKEALRRERGLECKALLVLSFLFFIELEWPHEVILYVSSLEELSAFFFLFLLPQPILVKFK